MPRRRRQLHHSDQSDYRGADGALRLYAVARLQGGPAQGSADVPHGGEPVEARTCWISRAYFAGQKITVENSKGDQSKVARGRKVSDDALCTMCHLGGFSGQNEIPKTGGQHYEYVLKQLQDFKARRRTNDAGNMTAVLRTIADEDLEALAAYVASLD